jgi:hypothetical protein
MRWICVVANQILLCSLKTYLCLEPKVSLTIIMDATWQYLQVLGYRIVENIVVSSSSPQGRTIG